MTGPQHEEIHAVDTNANPTGKGGLSDSYSIAWSENAAVLFISNLLGNEIGNPANGWFHFDATQGAAHAKGARRRCLNGHRTRSGGLKASCRHA